MSVAALSAPDAAMVVSDVFVVVSTPFVAP